MKPTKLICPKCSFGSGNDWEQCKGSCPMYGSPHYSKNAMANAPLSSDELRALLVHLDDASEWETVNDFWKVWSPRLNDRLRRLIITALGPDRRVELAGDPATIPF